MSKPRKSQRLPASIGEAKIISLPTWRLISGWSAPASKNLNLLDLGRPPRGFRRTLYWWGLGLSIALHGAFLAYVLASARMPGAAEMTVHPQANVAFIGTAERRPLPRADREGARRRSPSDRQDPPSRHADPSVTAPPSKPNGIADLPRDIAPSGPNAAGRHPHAIPVDYRPSADMVAGPRLEEAQAVASAPHETRLSVIGVKDVLLQDSRGDKADLGTRKQRQSSASERASQMYLPKADRRFAPLPEDVRGWRGPPPADAGSVGQLALLAVPPPPAAPQAMPLPVRRSALLSGAASGAVGDAKRGPPGNSVEGYLADVRAHLAEHRPKGGAGAGNVLVGFTLSRTGQVVSALILRSSGSVALDNSVLGAVRRSAPYPKAPVAATATHLQFAIPFRFR